VIFGPQVSGGQPLHAGALAFTDARLLAFPVRSLSEVFIWITCPLALGRLCRDLALAGHNATGLYIPAVQRGKAVVPVVPGTTPQAGQPPGSQQGQLSGTLVLEDLSFQAVPDPQWGATAQRIASMLPSGAEHSYHRGKLACHLAVLHDDDFGYLVQHATPVTARIVLKDETKTTDNLWYEESIPADTLFYCLVKPEQPRAAHGSLTSAAAIGNKFEDLVGKQYLQIGGNETVGHGWCAIRLVEWAAAVAPGKEK
jgi:CRISPR-associated protein Cmr4